MPFTDMREDGLEDLITNSLVIEANYVQRTSQDYNRDLCLDTTLLLDFLHTTQSAKLNRLSAEQGAHMETRLLRRISEEIGKRSVIDVLRNGVKHGIEHFTLHNPAPSSTLNPDVTTAYAQNLFSITRQLHYSQRDPHNALDLVVAINGIPIITAELKNRITGQSIHDAIRQYQQDRDPREPLFALGRCLVHFAIDDQLVYMTTHLRGSDTTFLPFNLGFNGGAGNPVDNSGIRTRYLWHDILTKLSLSDIIEHFVEFAEDKPPKGKSTYRMIFPRYHQLDFVRKARQAAKTDGIGKRYLVQHSAGSGKSNSIAWLALQLVETKQTDNTTPLFDSVIVVTDRVILDTQIRNTIKQFGHVKGVIAAADHSSELRDFLHNSKRLVITNIFKFPYALKDMHDMRNYKFAIIIDEAHSSQSGEVAAKMNATLGHDEDAPDDIEERINQIIEEQRMLPNASYFAFTATPKNRTLEKFGTPQLDGSFTPFHVYTMRQAIEEEFIIDVLQNYTTLNSYYRITKKIIDSRLFDAKRAQQKIRHSVEEDPEAIRRKVDVMLEHFDTEIYHQHRLNSNARAMIVTSSIRAAVRYKIAVDIWITYHKANYQTIVAFTGNFEEGGKMYNEATMNGFPSSKIPERFKEEPYRILIVAEKFQTGFDEPLLHTMYVDKPLSDVKAVQTLSRLNRAYKPWKTETFILDFVNDADTIKNAFDPYYSTTILSEGTDLNRLNDLSDELDRAGIYTWANDIEPLIIAYIHEESREVLDPILDRCSERYKQDLDLNDQIEFKSKAKSFVRTYQFLVMIQPHMRPEWEKLKTFLKLLIPKLPIPQDDDLTRGILESIDLESYRIERKATERIILEAGEPLSPTPPEPRHTIPEPLLDTIEQIIVDFNARWGTNWNDSDRIRRFLFDDIVVGIAQDFEFQNAQQFSDEQNARVTHDKKVADRLRDGMHDQRDLYQRFVNDKSFHDWVLDALFRANWHPNV